MNKHKPEFKIGDWINISGPAGTFVDQISSINHRYLHTKWYSCML